mmetsp:Transcript_5926/g.10010  ORF Transcript_5926/g.10010 Transcript_5926/m.10010 type:complete len:349 (-) Transcript_5926:151-1197(-)
MFELLFRFAFPDDPAAFERYSNHPPISVARVTLGDGESMNLTGFGPSPIRPRTLDGSAAEAEHARAEQHQALLARIEMAVLQGEGTSVESGEVVLTAVRSPVALRRRAVPDDGAAGCLLDNLAGLGTQNCQGDTRDTSYRLALPLHSLEAGEFVYAVGLNHARLGMGAYSNIALYDLANKTGVIDLADHAMVGSVTHVLGESAASAVCGNECDDLFAIRLDFDCLGSTGSSSFCIDIPLSPGQGMAVVERAYLHPETLVGPHESAMVPLELIVFKRRERYTGFGGGWLEALSAWRRTLEGIPFKQHLRVFTGATMDAMARGESAKGLSAIIALVVVKVALARSKSRLI